MKSLEQLVRDCRDPRAFARGYLDYLSGILKEVDEEQVAGFVRTVLAARARDAQIFFMGNGGSAATASHFANDFGVGSRSWRKPFRAVSLADNVAVLTAIGNDYGYDQIFTLQLRTRMQPGDVVVAISASGNSPNVLRAVEYARGGGAITVALTAFDGGALKKLADVNVHVPTRKGEYGPAEDVHMILDHLVAAYLIGVCRAEEGRHAA